MIPVVPQQFQIRYLARLNDGHTTPFTINDLIGQKYDWMKEKSHHQEVVLIPERDLAIHLT